MKSMKGFVPTIAFLKDEDDEVTSTISQPLLYDDGSDIAQVPMGNEGEKTELPGTRSFSRYVFLGAFTGFFIQMVSLGSYAFLLTSYGMEDENDSKAILPPTSSGTNTEWLLYGVLSALTQVDLLVYVMIWIGFTCTMTRNGFAFIRFQYQAPVRRRYIFVLGVYFLTGIVLGAFLAWSLIDVYLGFPIPLVPIAATVIVDLFLCYLMVWCYDLGKEQTTNDDGDARC